MTLTIIMTVKYCFAIATTFTTPQSRQKINLFSFQHYLHYTITIRKILQYFLPQEVHCFWKICTWYSSFTVRTFSELWVFFFSQELQCFYKFCTWCNGFTANNFSGVLHFLLPYNNAYESKETSWKHFILFYIQ